MHSHRIVIVGGTSRLELATRPGNKFGKSKRARVTLVDAQLTYLWKPLLHEVAAGTFDSHENDVDYIAQAHQHHFDYRLGRMDSLDRERREVSLAPRLNEDGREIVPRRTIPYDSLMLAPGNTSNDFDIPGVREHCVFIGNHAQADAFQRRDAQPHPRTDAA